MLINTSTSFTLNLHGDKQFRIPQNDRKNVQNKKIKTRGLIFLKTATKTLIHSIVVKELTGEYIKKILYRIEILYTN